MKQTRLSLALALTLFLIPNLSSAQEQTTNINAHIGKCIRELVSYARKAKDWKQSPDSDCRPEYTYWRITPLGEGKNEYTYNRDMHSVRITTKDRKLEEFRYINSDNFIGREVIIVDPGEDGFGFKDPPSGILFVKYPSDSEGDLIAGSLYQKDTREGINEANNKYLEILGTFLKDQKRCGKRKK